MSPLEPHTAAEWAKHPLALAMTEAALQKNVELALKWQGWIVFHDGYSRRSQAGFPDICAVRPSDGRLLFAELKSQKGRLRTGQILWLSALEKIEAATGGLVQVRVWRCSDWLSGEVERAIR